MSIDDISIEDEWFILIGGSRHGTTLYVRPYVDRVILPMRDTGGSLSCAITRGDEVYLRITLNFDGVETSNCFALEGCDPTAEAMKLMQPKE